MYRAKAVVSDTTKCKIRKKKYLVSLAESVRFRPRCVVLCCCWGGHQFPDRAGGGMFGGAWCQSRKRIAGFLQNCGRMNVVSGGRLLKPRGFWASCLPAVVLCLHTHDERRAVLVMAKWFDPRTSKELF